MDRRRGYAAWRWEFWGFTEPGLVVLAVLGLRRAALSLIRAPRQMIEVRRAAGEEAARITELGRTAGVWALIMTGSYVAAIGAVIQLVPAYA